MNRHYTNWRRAKLIDWRKFADNTRWRYGATTFDDVEDALRNTLATYRKDLWARTPVYIEIWCEKDAISSLLLEVADTFGVKVFPFHGMNSVTALNNTAEYFAAVKKTGRDVYVYYFGDHDPTGVIIDKVAIREIRDRNGVDFHFERIGVTETQVKSLNLPTRPTKKSDPNAKKFKGRSVDIDAVPVDVLRALVDDCITKHIDQQEWAKLKKIEKLERASLIEVLNNFNGGTTEA